MILGANATCDWVASDFDLDWATGSSVGEVADGTGGSGWKVLEITWLSTQGNIIWVDTGLWLALACALFLIHHVVATAAETGSQSIFPIRWARFGSVTGFFCLLDFLSHMLQWAWGRFWFVSALLSLLNATVLLPIWLVWFGLLLPKAQQEGLPPAILGDDVTGGHRSTKEEITTSTAEAGGKRS